MTDAITPSLLVADDWADYALLDAGDGRKLERFGRITVDRPDGQALWPPTRPLAEWSADAVFSSEGDDDERGAWRFPSTRPPERWEIGWRSLRLYARCTPFRHMGLFPEHAVHWGWAIDRIRAANRPPGNPVRVLNLFGYTGVMSLACAVAGAEVTHLDASAKAIAQARENQTLSGLDDKPIRWICDDTMKFVEREIRRGRTYDGVVLDPPKYGRGPKNEVWRFEQDFPGLLGHLRLLLSETPLFVITSAYAVRLSYLAVGQSLQSAMSDRGGLVEAGEMAIPVAGSRRLLPTALFARWQVG